MSVDNKNATQGLMSTIQVMFDAGVRHHQAGQLDDAEQLYKKILSLDPHHADSLHLLGIRKHQAGELDAAVALINRAIQIRKNAPSYYSSLGNVLKDKNRLDDALAQYRRAIALNPVFAEAHYNLATVLQNQGKRDESAVHYQKAITIDPNLAPAYNNLANILRDQGKFDEAALCLEHAIALVPNFAEAYYNLATVRKDQDRFDEAAAHYQRAITLKPDYVEAHNNLGIILKDHGELTAAMTQFDNVIAIKPDHVEAHVNKGMALLLAGDFTAGWHEYEWRLRLPGSPSPAAPLWNGSDLQGKTILLVCEQGFGDSLQFIRYAAMVKNRGAQVLLSCPRPLARLFASVDGIDQIFSDGLGIPSHDCFAPLMSLPSIFGTRLETIPHRVPYLTAPPELFDVWASLMQPYAGLKVGLVWAGNSRLHDPNARAVDRRRSLHLDQLASLADIPNAHIFSLQKGTPDEQIKIPPAGLSIIDFMERVHDFADTAGLIANLDLVIGVDTAVIHLAAAMGKPVWVLSRFDGCWRWLTDRDDSPWYPTLRLFRQPAKGDWQTVVEQVRTELIMRDRK